MDVYSHDNLRKRDTANCGMARNGRIFLEPVRCLADRRPNWPFLRIRTSSDSRAAIYGLVPGDLPDHPGGRLAASTGWSCSGRRSIDGGWHRAERARESRNGQRGVRLRWAQQANRSIVDNCELPFFCRHTPRFPLRSPRP
ncbi:hypothetical protein Aduo_015531 [Ancylostoma duodenale]